MCKIVQIVQQGRKSADGPRFAQPSGGVHQLSGSFNRFPLFYNKLLLPCNVATGCSPICWMSTMTTVSSQAKAAVDAAEKARIISDLRTKVAVEKWWLCRHGGYDQDHVYLWCVYGCQKLGKTNKRTESCTYVYMGELNRQTESRAKGCLLTTKKTGLWSEIRPDGLLRGWGGSSCRCIFWTSNQTNKYYILEYKNYRPGDDGTLRRV